jgi:hypothetical protein
MKEESKKKFSKIKKTVPKIIPGQRLKCVNAKGTYGGLEEGEVYTAYSEDEKHPKNSYRIVHLKEIRGRYLINRFEKLN